MDRDDGRIPRQARGRRLAARWHRQEVLRALRRPLPPAPPLDLVRRHLDLTARFPEVVTLDQPQHHLGLSLGAPSFRQLPGSSSLVLLLRRPSSSSHWRIRFQLDLPGDVTLSFESRPSSLAAGRCMPRRMLTSSAAPPKVRRRRLDLSGDDRYQPARPPAYREKCIRSAVSLSCNRLKLAPWSSQYPLSWFNQKIVQSV